jgi:hypothetical protein
MFFGGPFCGFWNFFVGGIWGPHAADGTRIYIPLISESEFILLILLGILYWGGKYGTRALDGTQMNMCLWAAPTQES